MIIKSIWAILWDWLSITVTLVAMVYAFVFSYAEHWDKATFFLVLAISGVILRDKDK